MYILASNWKANFTFQEAKVWFDKVSDFISNQSSFRVIAAVPFVYIQYLVSNYSNIEVFSQNISHILKGAFTGEVTISMLKSVNFKGSIVGHSERRHIFKEDDDIINKKILILQQNEADIIFCIGETLEERKSNKTKEVLYNQLVRGLKDLNRFDLLILAYEPVWAIGTGVPIDIDSLLEVESFLKYTFKNEFGIENIYLLYGGSVDVDFAKKLRDNKVMDGVLVGSASWNADNFIKIIQSFV